MSEPSYFEKARIQRARDYANQPWMPYHVVCEKPPAYSGDKMFARLVTLQRQIERMIEGSTKP
ncbi:MAG: hypothetical protein CMN85_10535 [Spongiibacteraceae bacterium]|nr:hypothetical protein [Spongiibacteraceae bacterium]